MPERTAAPPRAAATPAELPFRSVIDTALDAIILTDADGRILEWGPQAVRTFGWSRAEAVGRPLADTLLPPRFREDYQRGLRRYLATGEGSALNRCLQLPALHRDGHELPVELSVTLLRWDNRPVFCAFLRDISARKQAEEEMVEAHQLSQQIIATVREGILVFDRALRYVKRNPYMEELTGLPTEALLGKQPWDVFPFLREQGVEALMRRALEGETVQAPDLPYHIPETGAAGWWAIRVGPLRDTHGRIVGVLATVGDVTARKQTEQALRESELRLRLAVEAAELGPWLTETATDQLVWSKRAKQLFGLAPDEPVTRAVFIARLHPEDRDRVSRARLQADDPASTGEFDVEHRVVWPDGTVRWLAAQGRAIFEGEGAARRCVRFVGISRDVTERKLAEEERREFEVRLQQTQKLESLGVLAGGIAHDFNNLLTGILGHADLALLGLPLGAAARVHLEQVIAGARQAADLTRQMLAYAGKGRLTIQPVHLPRLVRDIADLLRVSISRKCLLQYHLADDLPPIEGDATQLRQVIVDLTNASEAIGDQTGLITLRTAARPCDDASLGGWFPGESLPPGPCVCLEVADTGAGMNEEVRSRIFEPFFTTKFTGRGLGLAAVLGIVRAHRGAIRVTSELGRGTVFQLLPALPPAPLAAPAPPAPPPAARGSDTILVVDDEEFLRDLARRMLERQGYAVLTAADGREAVEVYRRHADAIRLVLLDLTMPHLDGVEAFRALRNIRADVRVLLCSGYGDQEVARRCAEPGLAGFLPKPYRVEDLTRAIGQALGRS